MLSEKEAIKYIRDIVEGIKCLYENNIMHRDLKPENIILHND
jgi:serine/threonine protein kinase